MEVSSQLKFDNFLIRPSILVRPCTRPARVSFLSSPRPLCTGLYLGSFSFMNSVSRNATNYANPRSFKDATWCFFKSKDKFVGSPQNNKLHDWYQLSRYIVVRSGVVGTGTPDAAYPLSEPHLGSKIRGICFYAVTAVVAIFLFVLMVVAHPFVLLLDRYRRKAHHLIAKMWALATISPFLKVKFEGLENLPSPDTPAVYVSNHQSFLDIYTLLTLGRSFKFISKTSIFLFPIIGWAMYFLGTIPLKRMDSRSQLECLKRCMDLVKKGASVFVFPEGTRSKDGKLGAFKKGAFSIAVKPECQWFQSLLLELATSCLLERRTY
ncbi:1-acylglycerol-3-phosphate O-acyltransferase [Bertholletia excelsa]